MEDKFIKAFDFVGVFASWVSRRETIFVLAPIQRGWLWLNRHNHKKGPRSGKDEFQESLTISTVWLSYYTTRRDSKKKWDLRSASFRRVGYSLFQGINQS